MGRVPLDDITALILSGPQVTLSKTLLVALAERKAVVINCGRDWMPVSLTLPFVAHYEAAGVLADQIDAGGPLKKRLWQHLVRAKITAQASVLSGWAPGHTKVDELGVLARRVKSGDPENMEAQAARHYWTALMGSEFRRDRFACDGNVFLNYGYTVLRAATARAVVGAGLQPSLGLHHGHRGNPFALVDDLMEPFRPLVDDIVRGLTVEGSGSEFSLNPDHKRALVAVLQRDLITDRGVSPVINCLARLAQSLAASLAEKKDRLALPEPHLPGRLI